MSDMDRMGKLILKDISCYNLIKLDVWKKGGIDSKTRLYADMLRPHIEELAENNKGIVSVDEIINAIEKYLKGNDSNTIFTGVTSHPTQKMEMVTFLYYEYCINIYFESVTLMALPKTYYEESDDECMKRLESYINKKEDTKNE